MPLSQRVTSAKLIGIFFLSLLFAFGLFPMAAQAEEKAPAPAENAPCQGLKPFKEIDELMHQIYSNLDSDCLFKMDPKELAKIWGIPSIEYRNIHKSPVYSEERRAPAEGDHDYLLLKVYDNDEDPYTDYFIITLDHDKEAIKHPFFPDSDYPKFLPDPLICGYAYQHLYWFNSDKTRELSLAGGDEIIQDIYVLDFDRRQFIGNCNYNIKK